MGEIRVMPSTRSVDMSLAWRFNAGEAGRYSISSRRRRLKDHASLRDELFCSWIHPGLKRPGYIHPGTTRLSQPCLIRVYPRLSAANLRARLDDAVGLSYNLSRHGRLESKALWVPTLSASNVFRQHYSN